MKNVLTRVFCKIGRALRRKRVLVPVNIPVFRSELLKGRRAVVTGGTKGIGFSIAKAFKDAGADVLITGHDKVRLVNAVSVLGVPEANGILLDNENVSLVDGALDKIGRFDILVNNAGCVSAAALGSTEEDAYDKTMSTNLKGPYFISQAVANRWMTQGVKGNILNICSASSLRPGDSPYILSKWGMRSLTLGLAKKLIRYGIVVNGIAPGITNTEQFLNKSELGLAHERNPSGRMVTVDEVANMAVILVSDLAKMIVGDVIYMTGGAGIVTMD